MQQTQRLSRQAMGCGFEPPAPENVPVRPWGPISGRRYGYDYGQVTDEAPFGERAPTACPGYTCSLPEVIEAARARLHWNKGQIAEFTGGKPTERMLELVEILEGEMNACQQYTMIPASKGGGLEEGG